MKRIIVFFTAAALLSTQAKTDLGLERVSENNKSKNFDQKTGICLVCKGKKCVENRDYNSKKISSRKIINCPACGGKGKIKQTLKGLWGVNLYRATSSKNGHRQDNGAYKYLFTPQKKYMKFGNYSFLALPKSKKVFAILAEYHAKSAADAELEADVFLKEMKKACPDVQCTELSEKEKIYRHWLAENLDTKVYISINEEYVTKICMFSNNLLDSIEKEAASMPPEAASERKTQNAESNQKTEIKSSPMDRHNAWVFTQYLVERKLLSPKSASFEFGGARRVEETCPGIFIIRSYVDSDNAFGVKIRTHFFCKLQKISDDSFDVIQLTFE